MSDTFQSILGNSENLDPEAGKNANLIIPTVIILSLGSCMFLTEIYYFLKAFDFANFTFGFFIIMIFISTSFLNSKAILRACHEKKLHSFTKLIKESIAKPYSTGFVIGLIANNIIILSILQQRVSVNIHYMFSSQRISAIDIFYIGSLVAFPLMYLSSKPSFSRTRIFSVTILVLWAYTFIGGFTEEASTKTEYKSPVHIKVHSGYSVIASTCLFFYFTSFYQVVPYLYKEVKLKSSMDKILMYSAGIMLGFIIINAIYSTMGFDSQLDFARGFCFATIGVCGVLINMVLTRECCMLAFEEDPKEKMKSRDFIISFGVFYATTVLATAFSSFGAWETLLGLGCSLNAVLGILVPGIVYYKIAAAHENKLKISLLVLDSVLTAIVVVLGFYLVF